MIEIEVRPMRPSERIQAAGVAARGMRDNPIHVAVFGRDPDRRATALDRLFRALFAEAPEPPAIALRAGFVVGVCGAVPPGGCRLPPSTLLRVLAALARGGVGPVRRSMR